ncbi:MAG: molecular chaperone HtpG [Negativicutes bacterium]
MTQHPIGKETREFQTETKQLLDLMIHSIYTNREIFLRELISNASDAIDKIRVQSLTNHDLLEGDPNFEITLAADEKANTLTLTDNGIGMTYDEVVENIGTIAKSGTKSFLEKLKEAGTTGDSEFIGQFGVGFYSSFMVAERVTLITRAPGETRGVRWESTGDGTYTIEECDREKRGTCLILSLHPDFHSTEHPEENFLNQYTLQRLVKKYSDYIRYPIKMTFTVKGKEGEADTLEVRTLNSMTPLWVRSKNEIKPEEYSQFYKDVFHAWDDPLEIIHTKAEGAVEYTTLLFIPSHAPFDFYQREMTSGIRLYSKNVFVMDNYQDLLPEYLRFVQGLVDSPDFSLNISRELLQHSSQLKKIGKNLEKTVFKTLEKMLEKDRPKYKKFWQEYGKAIKNGVYSDYANREKLQDLLMFPSSISEDEPTTIAEYIARMPETQTVIYYAAGKDRSTVERLPQMEILKEKGLEVLYLFDRVDEFAIDSLREYKEKKFQSISRGDLKLQELGAPKDKQDDEAAVKENESLIAAVKEQLKNRVADVKISNRLKTSPVCLVSGDEGISLAMEQILSEMEKPIYKASRILELNSEHELFATLKNLYATAPDSENFKDYCELLYGQALLMEGLTPEDPIGFAAKVARLMTTNSGK